jgi:hypothetical protein
VDSSTHSLQVVRLALPTQLLMLPSSSSGLQECQTPSTLRLSKSPTMGAITNRNICHGTLQSTSCSTYRQPCRRATVPHQRHDHALDGDHKPWPRPLGRVC